MRKLRAADQKHGLYILSNNMIELTDGLFIVEIGSITKASQEKMSIYFFAIMNRKPFKNIHLDSGFIFKNILNPPPTVIDGEKRLLLGIDSYGHDDLIKNLHGT